MARDGADGYDPAAYGQHYAAIYDLGFGSEDDPELVAGFLAELAGVGPALELGIGTGNFALPLARRGVDVHGIDASPAMVERLRAKPGGADLPVVIGDFATLDVPGTFALIYIIFNTLFLLPSQAEQVRCLCNVAARLGAGGLLLVEAFIPDLARYTRNQVVDVNWVDDGRVMFTASRLDPAAQKLTLQHVVLRDGEVQLHPVELRYAWPAELDLMAGQAGLRLRARYAGWQREPFTPGSQHHVSVYERG